MECSSMCSTAYEPPESLWRLVEESVSLEERGEIREILGDSLVDQSLELHTEAGALLEIWQHFKYETDDMTLSQPKILPEPPGMRDSLRNHIKMLVENIRERSKITGRDSDILLSNHKNDIIEYALEGSSRGSSPIVVQSRPGSSPIVVHSRPGSSPIVVQSRPSSSISSRSGRETPMRITPSSEDDRLSGSSSASDKVNSVRDRLNVLKIDEVVQELRGTLEDEVAQLISDIKFLQNCLEDERDFRCESQMSVYSLPSMQDLREERSKLEKMSSIVPDAVDVIATIPRVRRKSMPGSPKRILKPLAPISPAGKSQIKSRPLPLKARHPHVTGNRSNEGIIQIGSIYKRTVNNNRVSNNETLNGREMIANSNSSSSSSSPMQPSPPSSAISSSSSLSPMQPSPPSSASRSRGSPTSNRFRQRFRNVQRQNSSTS